MKTTVDIHDELLTRAKRRARETGRPLRALIEDGLREVLDGPAPRPKYRLPDFRVGNPNDPNPLENLSWDELRDIIYEGR